MLFSRSENEFRKFVLKKKSHIAESALFVYFLLSLFGQNNLINNINSWKFVDNEIWNSLSDPVNILKYS